jgi:hypothetical protein
MARIVLLIEPDVDVLGVLASKLRARGLEVWIADGIESAISRARASLPDVVLVSEMVDWGLEQAFAEVAGLSALPCFRLVEHRGSVDAKSLLREDLELIARRVHALPSRTPSVVPEASDFRGDLAQVSVVDLIQLLGANQRSGVLTLQTPLGTGEVRFGAGEVLDALYRRLEGKKALFRLLGERDGAFSFVGGVASSFLRRIHAPTNALLMDGIREIDEARELRSLLSLGDDALIALAPPQHDTPEVDAMVLNMLVTPRTLPELLDEVSALDLDVLRSISELLAGGSVRRITGGTRRVELGDADRLGVLAALTKRIAKPGFRDSARVAIAASPSLLLSVLASLGRIAEAVMPTEVVPTAPIPHVLATLRLGEAVELDVLGVPLVEAYAPLWAIALPGCAALATLEEGPRDTLENACQVSGVPIVEAPRALDAVDEADPEAVAGIVQRLLEVAAGA